ncbi:inositol hexakisphosphate anddiphosphoinositol-pentakisphosphate kinase 1, partial [Striga asiatica]
AANTWLDTRFLAQKFKEFNFLEGRVYGITDWNLELDEKAFKLTESTLIFKVSNKKDQFGSYNGPFTVARITVDPILVNRFGVLANPSQMTAMLFYFIIMYDSDGELNSPNKTVSGCKEKIKKRVQKVLFKDASSSSEVPMGRKIKAEEI